HNRRHAIQQAVDTGAQGLNVSSVAVERNAEGQIIFLSCLDDVLDLLDGELECLLGLNFLSDVGRIFDDLDRLAAHIGDGVVARLDPNIPATLGDTLVLAGVKFTAPEFFPEEAILRALTEHGVHKHTVMLAPDLVQAVADRTEE